MAHPLYPSIVRQLQRTATISLPSRLQYNKQDGKTSIYAARAVAAAVPRRIDSGVIRW
jgi:hypothetical protein